MKLKKLKGLVILFLIPLILPINVSAKTLRDLQAEYDELERAYAEKQTQIDNNQNEQHNTSARIDEIYGEMAQAEQDIAALNTKIQELNAEIDEKDEQIKEVMKFYQVSNGESALLEYLFSAKSITDFIYRSTVTEQLSKYNSQLIDEMHDLIEQSKKAIQDLHEKEKELQSLQDELKGKLSLLQLEEASLQDEGETIEKNIEISKSIIQFYIDKGCDIDDDISVCARGLIPAGSGFNRPLESGYMVSTWYSDYLDGEGGACRWHAGVDIGAAEWTPIYAAAEGLVSYAGYAYDGYGNKVVINHYINGQDYTTLYGHMIAVNVSEGDLVTPNTVIGYVGNTGNSYGNHLHFNLCIGTNSCLSVWQTTDPGAYINFPPNHTSYYGRQTYYEGYYSNPCGW